MRSSVSIPRATAYGEDEDIPNIADMSVQDAIYHTAHKCQGGIQVLASRMGKSVDTLNHKVNPNNTTHHTTVEEALQMQEFSGLPWILQAEAARLGYNVIKSVPASTDDPHALYWQMNALVADLQHAVSDAFAAGVTGNSMRRCDGLASEAISAINNLLAGLRAQLPTPPKSFNS
jgi:hypothetical protein